MGRRKNKPFTNVFTKVANTCDSMLPFCLSLQGEHLHKWSNLHRVPVNKSITVSCPKQKHFKELMAADDFSQTLSLIFKCVALTPYWWSSVLSPVASLRLLWSWALCSLMCCRLRYISARTCWFCLESLSSTLISLPPALCLQSLSTNRASLSVTQNYTKTLYCVLLFFYTSCV